MKSIDASGNSLGSLTFNISPDKKESSLNRGIAAMPKVLKNGKYAWDCDQLSYDQQSLGALWAYIDVTNMTQEDLKKYGQARVNGQIEDYYKGQPWAWAGTYENECLFI